jgi:hypothetical protein
VILQRLARSLGRKDWGTVLAEILIVVLGIYIGLQVDDWNQSRKDRNDERTFLNTLHEDVLRVDELSRRLRQRRLDRLDWTLNAGDVLFGRNDRETFTENECAAIVWSSAFNLTATGLPSVEELIGTGRMGIVRDIELRTALVALRQTRAALDATISEKTASANFISLPSTFPELFKMSMYFDDTVGEIFTKNECDLAAMRSNQHFLNQFSANADGYDAYVRDGVRPWSQQFERVHARIDAILSINHEKDVNE